MPVLTVSYQMADMQPILLSSLDLASWHSDVYVLRISNVNYQQSLQPHPAAHFHPAKTWLHVAAGQIC